MFFKSSFSLCALASTVLLGSCGYALDSSNQDITFLTPGVEGAKCEVMANKIKYTIHPPQTKNVKKSSKDMNIECMAPGNRSISMNVPARLSTKAVWGGPGLAWDYASHSSHFYPTVIAIDFSHEEVRANTLPLYEDPALDTVRDPDLDEISTALPRLNADRGQVQFPVTRRGTDAAIAHEDTDAIMKADSQSVDDVIDRLTGRSATPSTEDAVDAPVSIYPGQ